MCSNEGAHNSIYASALSLYIAVHPTSLLSRAPTERPMRIAPLPISS